MVMLMIKILCLSLYPQNIQKYIDGLPDFVHDIRAYLMYKHGLSEVLRKHGLLITTLLQVRLECHVLHHNWTPGVGTLHHLIYGILLSKHRTQNKNVATIQIQFDQTHGGYPLAFGHAPAF